MTQAVQVALIVAAFLLALIIAPLALGLGVVWLLWRLAVFASAARGSATIVGWTGQGDRDQIEQAQAFPKLRFDAYDGSVRHVTSRLGFNIYDDPPPEGALPIRYHLKPRLFAEIDDRAHWFTAPALTIAAALLGSFLAGVWRSVAVSLFGV